MIEMINYGIIYIVKKEVRSMIIKGTRIQNVDKYLLELKQGESFYIGLQNATAYVEELEKYGIGTELSTANSFLPRPIKAVTRFNANGKWINDKSVPMEDRDFECEYHVKDWHGNDHYGTRYYTRKCYRRNLILPPEIRLTYIDDLIISPLLEYTQDNKILIQHVINIYLEIFGICETLTENYNPKKITKMERLSWEVLPKGEYPWEKAKVHLETILDSTPARHKNVINRRHEVITEKVPDFMAIGDQGFWGYVIYGFTNKNIFIFESNKPDNATYVFRGNWKEASRLTKSEILSSELEEARIIHNQNWNSSINKLIR